MSLVSLILEQPGDGWISLGSGAVGKKKAAKITDPNIEKKEKDGVWYYREKKQEPVVQPKKDQTVVTPKDEPKKEEPKKDEPKVVSIYDSDFDQNIVAAATGTTFYDTNGWNIKWLNYENNLNYDKDNKIIDIINHAQRIKNKESVKDIIAFIKAVVMFTENQISEFQVNPKYKFDVENYKGKLNESLIIKSVNGLKKLLVGEQRFVIRKEYDNSSYVGGVKQSNKRGRLTKLMVINDYLNNNVQTFSPLRLSSTDGLPDEAPIVGEVKAKLNKDGYNVGAVDNVFTKDLKSQIEKYRDDNKPLGYGLEKGDIDFQLIKKLFEDDIKDIETRRNKPITPANDKTTSKPSQTKKLPESFNPLIELSKKINGLAKNAQPLDINDCYNITYQYPKVVEQFKKYYTVTPESKIDNQNPPSELIDIKKSIKYCGVDKTGRMKLSGNIGDITRLDTPFQMSKDEIYGRTQ